MKKVLIIEDDQSVLDFLGRVVEKAGYMALKTTNGETGLQLIHEKDVSLLITDILMDGKEGIEIIKDVKINFPELKIIAISGGGKSLDSYFCLTTAKQMGASYTFEKPINQVEFLSAIKKCVGDESA